MESIFAKDHVERVPLTPHQQIAAEITHLDKKTSVRHGAAKRNKMAATVTLVVICALLGLYFMDPFFYALHKSEAIRDYLYLHNFDSGSQADALVASRILSGDEIAALNRQKGSYGDYYSSPAQAEEQAKSIASYMQSVHDLRAGRYQQLDPIGKLRYVLFIRSGLQPPTDWRALSLSVDD